MSLSDELSRRLEALKKANQEYSIFLSSIEGKKQIRENDVSILESRIEKLKLDYTAEQNKINVLLQKANDEAQLVTTQAKRLMQDAEIAKIQAQDDRVKAQKLMNEAQALMTQATQKQKEADNMYRQLEEKKNKLHEALR